MLPRRPEPPASTSELMTRALRLAGRPLSWVAAEVGVPVPRDLRRAKGWVGMTLEAALGATAGSRAEPDFPHLGVELKTIPVDERGSPRESTWVCFAPMDGSMASTWEASLVYHKLCHVLWIPIVGVSPTPVGDRLVGGPVLWRPSPQEMATLKADWQELSGQIALGELDQISAHHGKALQLRPKAANSRELTWVIGEEGEWVQANPVGFYLRTSFTKKVLARHLVMP